MLRGVYPCLAGIHERHVRGDMRGFDAVRDKHLDTRHRAQNSARQCRHAIAASDQRKEGENSAYKESEAGNLVADLGEEDDEQCQHRRLHKRPQSVCRAYAGYAQHTDTIGAAIDRQQRINRRQNGKDDDAMRFFRLTQWRPKHNPVRQHEAAQHRPHIEHDTQQIEPQARTLLAHWRGGLCFETLNMGDRHGENPVALRALYTSRATAQRGTYEFASIPSAIALADAALVDSATAHWREILSRQSAYRFQTPQSTGPAWLAGTGDALACCKASCKAGKKAERRGSGAIRATGLCTGARFPADRGV
jgi:hypothetical protein